RALERQRGSKQHEDQSGRQGKTGPGGEGAPVAGPGQPQGQSDLAAGWTGQELAEGHQIGVTALGQPAAADDKLVTEVAKVRHGPAKGSQAQTQKDQKDGPGTVAGCRI